MPKKTPQPMFGAAFLALCALFLSGVGARAATAVPAAGAGTEALKRRIAELETGLTSARQTEATLDGELVKLRKLLSLQQLEIQVGQGELKTMEEKLRETEAKKAELEAALDARKKRLREQLSQLPAMEHSNPISRLHGDEAVMRGLHVGMIDKLVQGERAEILQLRKLQEEVAAIDEKLREENEKVAGRVEDLKEKQTVLSLNREVSARKLEQTRSDHAARLREFREAKVSERKLEAVMTSLGDEPEADTKPLAPPSPVRFQRGPAIVAAPAPPAHAAGPAVKATAPAAAKSVPAVAAAPAIVSRNFFDNKGRLPLPVSGAVINGFGKKYDPKTNLYTFHKGIEIAAKPGSAVKAVFPGRVAFAGRLGGYRNLVIIDHGKQFYSLAGNLGETLRKAGDVVREGEVIGNSAADETPLYFEIRQRHIAVNPVPWFRDLKLLARSSAN